MSELLSLDDYRALADEITLPQASHIDGSYHKGSGPALTSTNPATGEILANFTMANEADVDFAVTKARDAFDKAIWANRHPSERKDILIKLAKLLKRNRHKMAVIESLDSGKPIRDCAAIDIPEAINTIIWHAEAIDKIYDDTAPVGQEALSVIVREPVGVVACILPWNFPLLMLAWKLGPALAAGNSLIVKPAEQTSLSALYLAELAHEAGIPRGVLQVLVGDGPTTGEAIGRHHDIDMVSFTGSTQTGKRFLTYAAESNMKEVTLECGGKNPAIVMDDADNLEAVAAHIANGAFWNLGQNCSATSRLIVHKDIKDSLCEKLSHHVKEWRQGDPLDPSHKLGVLVDEAHHAKVQSYIDRAHKESLPIIAKSAYEGIGPVIYDVPSNDCFLAQEEVFGPVLSVITVSSFDEAVRIANETSYGLAASLYTANIKHALRGARAIKAGTVTVNSYGEGDSTTPFGGYKQSGFGGRDNGLAAHDQFTQVKTIWLDLADNAPDEI
ncbi:MAG: aldehyde dehydrogenase [Candidatus Puniceispirillaceae bacterium]